MSKETAVKILTGSTTNGEEYNVNWTDAPQRFSVKEILASDEDYQALKQRVVELEAIVLRNSEYIMNHVDEEGKYVTKVVHLLPAPR